MKTGKRPAVAVRKDVSAQTETIGVGSIAKPACPCNDLECALVDVYLADSQCRLAAIDTALTGLVRDFEVLARPVSRAPVEGAGEVPGRLHHVADYDEIAPLFEILGNLKEEFEVMRHHIEDDIKPVE